MCVNHFQTKEKGLPEVDVNTELGILGPKGLSPEVIAKLVSSVDSTLKNPDVLKRFTDVDRKAGFSKI